MIDLRSDTLTRPSAGMREAIAGAAVGDDVYGDLGAVTPRPHSQIQQLVDLLEREPEALCPADEYDSRHGLEWIVPIARGAARRL